MSRSGAARWLRSTSNRTFVAWPVALFAAEAALQQGVPRIDPWALPLLAWGYMQYRLVGNYRLREGGGGPGLSNPPERLVVGGPYRWLHHPNYLAVCTEIAGLPLVHTAWLTALVFSVFNALILRVRIRAEEGALKRLTPYDEAFAR